MKKTYKLISMLLVFAMLLSMAPITVLAAEATPTAEIGGKTYYELDSADDLDWFAAQVNGGNTTINATLTKDITYNSGTMSSSTTGARVWTPVGTYEMPFEGIINGNGYTISGLYCKDPEGSPNLALVSYSVKATIANVAVTNFYFESKHGLIAGLASYAAGSTIYNCYAQGSIYAKDAGAAAAGICAAVFGHSRTEILNCLSDVALKVDDPSDFTVSGLSLRNYIGGIVCTGDKNNPVLIQKTVYITDRYNGTVYDENNSLASHFEIYDSEGMPASKLATGEIAYILGKGWGQKLGTDSIPEIGNSNIVNYGYVSCDADAQKVYTNSATNPNYPEHYDSETDSDNACDFCGINLHTHSFIYSASGDTITAVCENTDGNCPDPEGTLTILAPADLYVDSTAKEATVENNLVDTSVAISDITYSAPYGLPPKDAGTYTASVTVGGATATVEFTLLNYAAKVTDKDGNAVGTYKTLADAITAAQGSEGSTVTLLDDVTLTEQQTISFGKFTLDLNGKTLLNENDRVLYIFDEADITIKDSGEDGTVQTNGATSQTIFNFGTLTIENGLFKGPAGIGNAGTLNFKNGKIEADTYAAIRNSGTVYIYNGSFTSIDACAINVDTGGTAYIYGGEFSGFSGIDNYGTAYIEGGEFKGNSYAAFNLHSGTVEVTGGSFTGNDNEYGIFTGIPYGEWTVRYNEGATLTLKGGEFPNGFVTYKVTANALLAEDYYYKDADGKLIDVADDAKIINGYVKVSKGADLADAVITLDSTEFTYNGSEIKPTVIVTIGGKTLTEGKDYTLTFANNVNAGTATLTVKGIGQAAGGIAGGGENIGNSSNAGEAAESIYTGEVTKEFTIAKKAVTVTATAPDKVYDGTNSVDISMATVTLNGIVEGDDVKAEIVNGIFTDSNVGENIRVILSYTVSGDDLNNYEFPEDGMVSIHETNEGIHNAFTVASITAKDISDGFIILGETLTYNGKEQTQTVDKVFATGTLEVTTYIVSGNKATNVGVYLLTVTGTGNFTGEAKIAYKIALDNDCVSHIDLVYIENNGVYERKWKVKSTDRASVEYVLEQVSNAVTDFASEEQKSRWNEIKENCEEILGIINSIELFIGDVKEDYASLSVDTVKASDIPALDKIASKVNEIKDRCGYNLTDEEKQILEDILDGVEELRKKIAETEEKLEEIKAVEDDYNPETVTSDDKAAIEDKIAELEAVNSDNLTDEQKAEYDEIKAGFEALLEEIAVAEKAVEDIGIELEMFDEKRVTKFWEDDIEALKAKIDELLADENMGEAEKAKLNEYKAQAEKLIEIINTPKEYLSLRFFCLIWDCLTWIYNGILWLFSKIFGC